MKKVFVVLAILSAMALTFAIADEEGKEIVQTQYVMQNDKAVALVDYDDGTRDTVYARSVANIITRGDDALTSYYITVQARIYSLEESEEEAKAAIDWTPPYFNLVDKE